jgi:hypothetical protein
MLILAYANWKGSINDLRTLVTDDSYFHIVALTIVLSRIIKFTLTGFTTQSLYYPRIIHITTVKIAAAIIRCRFSSFCSTIGCVIVAFVDRRENKI